MCSQGEPSIKVDPVNVQGYHELMIHVELGEDSQKRRGCITGLNRCQRSINVLSSHRKTIEHNRGVNPGTPELPTQYSDNGARPQIGPPNN
jgi:hypothetical protein